MLISFKLIIYQLYHLLVNAQGKADCKWDSIVCWADDISDLMGWEEESTFFLLWISPTESRGYTSGIIPTLKRNLWGAFSRIRPVDVLVHNGRWQLLQRLATVTGGTLSHQLPSEHLWGGATVLGVAHGMVCTVGQAVVSLSKGLPYRGAASFAYNPIELEPWCIRSTIVYSERQQLPRGSGNLLPITTYLRTFTWRCWGLSLRTKHVLHRWPAALPGSIIRAQAAL